MQDGKIVQCDAPRDLYNHPADRFGGWFLGNPGMVFSPASLSTNHGSRAVISPLFPTPVEVVGADLGSGEVTIGIRPEQIRVASGPLPHGVPAQLTRKTIQIGGQYLVSLNVAAGEHDFKAKVGPAAGEQLPESGPVNVEVPLDRITLFDSNGNRIAATLRHAAAAPA